MSTTALDLATMRARRTTLEGEAAEAQSALDAARDGLITGSASAKQVVTAQSLADALEGALGNLDTQIHDAEQLEVAEQAAAYRKGLLDSLVAGAERATAHHQAATAALEKALADLSPTLEAAFGEFLDLHDLRERWASTLREFDRLQPVPGSALTLLEANTDLRDIRTKTLPGSWHHGLTNDPNSSLVQKLPTELFLLWQLFSELQRQAKLPRRALTGAGYSAQV